LLKRLVRFVATNGRTYYGDAILPAGVSDVAKARQARILSGSPLSPATSVTDEVINIRLLLAPLGPELIRTVRCLGLNYALHAEESGMPKPKFPILFYKPATSVSGPSDPIPIPAMAQEGSGLDYECELVIVIGRRACDVAESDALDYVLGYSVANDVSHRDWQIKHGGGQWSLGKGFDGWAPWGPAVVSSDLIKDPQTLRIWTKVNGKTVQDGNTSDMIFSVRKTVSFLSQGVTLLPGDIILTGT
jgi:2-keto-4-pentenoate hydratase/2-oxohepta-3-ene-1,7-dioic acid hydratase in catechol pathway